MAGRRARERRAARVSPETIRSDDGWDWLYPALHGHYLDHLAVVEPWTAEQAMHARRVPGCVRAPVASEPPAGAEASRSGTHAQ